MKNYTIEELKDEFESNGYKWFDFHIVGVRSKADVPDKFDDLIGLVENGEVKWFPATTNPGIYWLKNLLNPKGTAVLKANQYIDTYQLALHQGKYKALCQRKNVTVYRDANKNDKSEETNVIETGLFGINIHRSNEKFTSILNGKYSAGCQVFSKPKDFNYVIERCDKSKLISFTYTLLKEF